MTSATAHDDVLSFISAQHHDSATNVTSATAHDDLLSFISALRYDSVTNLPTIATAHDDVLSFISAQRHNSATNVTTGATNVTISATAMAMLFPYWCVVWLDIVIARSMAYSFYCCLSLSVGLFIGLS